MVGGAQAGKIGEIVLAHLGVLFLDELSEFARPTLEALRQPLEDGRIAIVRARHSAVYPARFMLVGASNPCPCGFAGQAERCRCSEADLARYRRRLSGPLLDRIDIVTCMDRPSVEDTTVMSSQLARERVSEARERQARRLREDGIEMNAHMDGRLLARHARLDDAAERVLRTAQEHGLVSARGATRMLRVARTIADLDGSDTRGQSSARGGPLPAPGDRALGQPSRVTLEACTTCLRRSWLLAQLSVLLDYPAADEERLLALLELPDEQLIEALAGRRRAELRRAYGAALPERGRARGRSPGGLPTRSSVSRAPASRGLGAAGALRERGPRADGVPSR